MKTSADNAGRLSGLVKAIFETGAETFRTLRFCVSCKYPAGCYPLGLDLGLKAVWPNPTSRERFGRQFAGVAAVGNLRDSRINRAPVKPFVTFGRYPVTVKKINPDESNDFGFGRLKYRPIFQDSMTVDY